MLREPIHVALRRSSDLSGAERHGLRALFDEAFAGEFSDDDWDHALGGWHALIHDTGRIVAHAAVVPRRLYIGERTLQAGYVEAVAVTPERQRRGLGTEVMARINDRIAAGFEIGALSTGRWTFYARLGWERWAGPSSVRFADGRVLRTADDDDGLMVFRCAATRQLDLSAPIACEARAGDSW